MVRNKNMLTQQTFTCSKSTIEKLEKGVEICSKLTIKTPKRRHRRRSGVIIVNFEHISQLAFCSKLTIETLEQGEKYIQS